MPSPKETLAQLTANKAKQKRRLLIESERLIYVWGESQLDGKEGPDPQAVCDQMEAAGRPLETIPDLIDLAAKRIGLVRTTEQEGPALKRQQSHSIRYRDALNKWEKEIKELRDRQ